MTSQIDPSRQVLEEIFAKGILETILQAVGGINIDKGRCLVLEGGNHRRIWTSNPLTGVIRYDVEVNVAKGPNYPSPNSKNIGFLAKRYIPRPRNLPPDFLRAYNRSKPWEYEFGLYQMLGGEDGSAIRHLPKAHLIGGVDKTLILEPAGKKTLEEEMTSEEAKEDVEKRVNLITNFLPAYAEFRQDALRRAIELLRTDKAAFSRFFGSMENTTRDKAINYLRAVSGAESVEELDREDVETLKELYWPIAREYDPTEAGVSHTDLHLSNILFNGIYSIIDPKLRLRNPLTSIGGLLSCAGVNLGAEEWERVLDAYVKSEAKACGFEVENGDAGEISLNPEARRKWLTTLLSGIFHQSFRLWAKDTDSKRYFPERNEKMAMEIPARIHTGEEMKRNMQGAIERLVSIHPDGKAKESLSELGRFCGEKIYPKLVMGHQVANC